MDPPERKGPIGPAPGSVLGGEMVEAPSETPTGAPGSEPPPSDAGDEAPDPSFPVPPVPPPPAAGPIFSLAGGGGGGAASFARPGTEAAKPFRSQAFSTNRSTSGRPVRFGAGTAVTAGNGVPFLPAGLDGAQAGPDDELQRLLALLQGAGGSGGGL